MKTLFKNVNILIRNKDKYDVIKSGFLSVDGKYIDYIGKDKPDKVFDIEKDYTNKLLMPGLVNAHTHIPMVFLRGVGGKHNLHDWLNNYIFPLEAKLNSEHIKWSSYYAILEMLAGGTTSFTDMYFFPEETAKAVIDSGIKANINKYILCFDDKQKIEDSMIDASVNFFKEYHNKADNRLKIDFAIHAQYTNKKHIVKEYSRLCKENNARMHLHLSETKSEHKQCIDEYGLTPTKWFDELNTFDNGGVAAHCVWCENDDVKILKDKDMSIAINPTSNMLLGSGFAPIDKFRKEGINLSIGTDGAASNNNLNMFEEMHLANVMFSGYHLDPTYIQDNEIIDMATINGAISQNRSDTGVLEVGKCADIIAIDFNKIHLYPTFDYATLLLSSVQASDVYMNMVDGKVLYEDGNYLTLDKDRIVYEFKKLVEEFY